LKFIAEGMNKKTKNTSKGRAELPTAHGNNKKLKKVLNMKLGINTVKNSASKPTSASRASNEKLGMAAYGSKS